ncbi:hypothetical protein COY07_01175 [Candidatus Peregrinibacteria bacterium CG_4_10_14_0_2_um_filter_43_11]|nr:MAG: hypothetical protein COY07_01175 [Candidatus Peregrinibacteria bacterium CG_4_10_14_0_2_um_filter_43_11]
MEAVNPAVLTSNLTIKSPSDDSELGSTSVIVTGQGDANINLKVFDNDSKIGDSETDEDGFFSFDAKNLENGSHVFYVMSEGGEVSNSVHVAIDTVPPVLSLLSVYPDGVVKPGDPLSITVQSEPDLDEVKVRLQGIEAALLASDIPGTYTATVAAPALEGTFPLDVILVDKLSNKAELSGQATVQTGALKPKSPPAVDGLEGTSGDAQVTLNWQAVIGHDNPIQRYRLYYGAHYNELNQTFETQGAVTTLTLSGLENGKQLFFAVKAVDSKGIESDDFGVTIALTPAAPAVPALAQPAFVGYQAIPMDGAVQLSWPAFPGVHAFYYKIYFGVKSGQYDDFAVTSDYSPYFTVRDLINEVPYHFVIAALDINGYEISSLSPEFTATPSVNALKPSAPSFASPSYSKLSHVPTTGKTGPEAVWIVLISSFLAYFFYHHKRRFIKRG